LKTKPAQSISKTFDAIYVVNAPGGTWDATDFGDYIVSSVFGKVAANSSKLIEAREVGRFTVRIVDPSVIYVNTSTDTPRGGSLRDAIIAANAAAPAPRTIILDSGSYTIDIAPVVDPAFSFPLPIQQGSGVVSSGVVINNWSNGSTGDYDVTGNITIIGNRQEDTSIDAQQLDRLFKVKAGGSLSLSRVTLKNGSSPTNQPGGAILSAGTLKLEGVIVSNNQTTGTSIQSADGGGIAVVGGTADIQRTQITNNIANASAGILFAGSASGVINQSTIDSNQAINRSGVDTYGAGIGSYSTGDVTVTNSTISSNKGIAAYSSPRFGAPLPTDPIDSPSVSRDGRYTVFTSKAKNLALHDNKDLSEIYLYDRVLDTLTLVSSGLNGAAANGDSFQPDISANGNFIAFASRATNLIASDTNGIRTDVFVYNRVTKAIQIVSTNSTGKQVSRDSGRPSISGDGRYVAFESEAIGLTPNDGNDASSTISEFDDATGESFEVPVTVTTVDIYRKDRTTGSVQLVSVGSSGAAYQPGFVESPFTRFVGASPSISDDGNTIAFRSDFRDLTSVASTASPTLYVRNMALSTSRALAIPTFATRPIISGNSSVVVYERIDAGVTQIYSYQLSTNANTLVSKTLDNTPFAFSSSHASVNFDGTLVSFQSSIRSLVPASATNSSSVYLKNLTSGAIRSVSAAAADAAAGGNNSLPILSGNGLTLAFLAQSQKSINVANGDETFYTDLFVYDLNTDTSGSATSISSGELKLINVTFAYNDSVVGATGRIVAGNSLFVGTTGIESITKFGKSLGHNLYDTTAPGPFKDSASDTLDVTLKTKLSAFTSFPGFTPGYALTIGNPAIDAADPLLSPTADQRNIARLIPDIGALEAVAGSIGGTLFVDSDGDKAFDREEVGLSGVTVYIDFNSDGNADPNEPTTITSNDDSSTIANETGTYSFVGLPPRAYSIGVLPPAGYSEINTDARFISTTGSSAFNSSRPSISLDGGIVAFEGYTDERFPGDTEGQLDIYIDNLSLGNLSRETDFGGFFPSISDSGDRLAYLTGGVNYRDLASGDEVRVANSGTEARISGDGLWVAYVRSGDVFLYNVTTGSISAPIDSFGGSAINGVSKDVSISRDGKFVVFTSKATISEAGILKFTENVFLYDVVNNKVDLISLGRAGTSADGPSSRPSVSDDGRIIAFSSSAKNLVIGNDTNNADDVFVYNLDSKLMRRVSVSEQNLQANGASSSPEISGDGRHVVFDSLASNLVSDDGDTGIDTFVYDLFMNLIDRVGGGGFSPTISRDGSFIAYRLDSSSVEVIANPLEPILRVTSIAAGQTKSLDLRISPLPGQITGTLFEDSVTNAALDPEEPVFKGWTVYLDDNNNGLLNVGEESVKTNDKGSYSLAGLAGGRNYTVAAVAPLGWTTVLPNASSRFQWNVFVPGGDTITGRDFGFRKVTSTGQSSASSVSGRLYEDKNGNGKFDTGDIPLANREVYLDATNFGVRDANEPRVLTGSDGMYTMSGLSSRTVAISTVLDPTLVHVNPLGSSFSLQKSPLYTSIRPFGGPQAIASGDFNADGFLDAAVALGEANKLSIRLNDKAGGFSPTEIDLDLGTGGAGPTSLVIGQFDNNSKLDVALTANYTGNVTVLLNFDPLSKTFASRSYVKVGNEPLDIAAGQFGGDSKPDLVVVNKADNSVQLLTNNGSGVFTAGAATASGGKTSVSLVVGNFTGDSSLDVAVVHASPLTTNTTNGGVTVLRGNSAGTLTLSPGYYQVGALPIDSVSADFNGDGRADLAVANFSSNSISILLGQADGTFKIQTAVLGTASGAFDIAIGDVDNDRDIDVIASNLRDRNISIFRNVGVVGGDVQFEPLENIGLGEFSLAQRMPLVVANFDNDASGPGNTGTVDIVTIPQQTDTLHVLKNKLVNGARRVALTGLNTVPLMDFIIKSAVLPPSFDVIANPLPVLEDAAQQTLSIAGIKKGRATGPALSFAATSSGLALIPTPSVSHVDGSSQATLRFTPNRNVSGTAQITVKATDAGADQLFGTSDDGIFTRSFTVTVLAVNDPPTFTTPAQTSATQKAGAQSIPNFVTGIGKGGGNDEVNQALSPFITSADPSFFTVQPAISSTGTLTFTPSPNKSGTVPVTLTLSDLGGKANGGNDTTTRIFIINVLPVNDAPTFTLGGNLTVAANAGAQTRTNFATGFLPGGGSDEAAQVVSDYIVTTNAPGLFSALPDIGNNGTLTFAPAIDRSGLATISVNVRDNGGQLNGGVDISAVKTFTINVTPVTTNYAIAATSAAKTEGQSVTVPTAFTFTVTRSGLTTGISTVDYGVTGNGTNPANAADFLGSALPSGTVVFPAGVTSRVVTINVAGDSAPERDEGFIVTLRNPSALGKITTTAATGTIQNDDISYAIAATSAVKAEGNSLITPYTFTVTRSGLTTGNTTVKYAVTGSTVNGATAADFSGNVLPTGTVTFAAGLTSQLVTINVLGDRTVEPNEGFIVTLNTPSAPGTITTAVASGTIQNDDTSYAIAATSAVKAEGNSLSTPTPYTFTVTRSGSTSGISTVAYAVTGSVSNPAVALDFLGNVLPTGTVVFAAGVTSRVVTINVVGDSSLEPNEGFIVTLNSPSAPGTITTAAASGTIQTDDTSYAIAATSAVKPEGNSGTTTFTFTVTRSGLTTVASTVNYAVRGSFSNGANAADFTGAVLPSGTLNFVIGEASKVITINVVGDRLAELSEGFIVTLSSPSSLGTLTTLTATGTIQNDD